MKKMKIVLFSLFLCVGFANTSLFTGCGCSSNNGAQTEDNVSQTQRNDDRSDESSTASTVPEDSTSSHQDDSSGEDFTKKSPKTKQEYIKNEVSYRYLYPSGTEAKRLYLSGWNYNSLSSWQPGPFARQDNGMIGQFLR